MGKDKNVVFFIVKRTFHLLSLWGRLSRFGRGGRRSLTERGRPPPRRSGICKRSEQMTREGLFYRVATGDCILACSNGYAIAIAAAFSFAHGKTILQC